VSVTCWRCGVLQDCGCGSRCGACRLLLLLLGCMGCGCGLEQGCGCASRHCRAQTQDKQAKQQGDQKQQESLQITAHYRNVQA
jgi:hypothetical protein